MIDNTHVDFMYGYHDRLCVHSSSPLVASLSTALEQPQEAGSESWFWSRRRLMAQVGLLPVICGIDGLGAHPNIRGAERTLASNTYISGA